MATQNQNLTTTSPKYTLNLKDVVRGFLVAGIGGGITTLHNLLIPMISGGASDIDWKLVGVVALSSGLAYLVKNFFTPAEIVVVDPPKTDLKAVEAGRASVEVKKTNS